MERTGLAISSTAAVVDIRTRGLRVGLFRAAWRVESVPAVAGSVIVFERVEPDSGSFGKGHKEGPTEVNIRSWISSGM